MNDWGRFFADLNRNLDQILYTVDRLQSLYQSFQRISPLWEPIVHALRGPLTTASAGVRGRRGRRRRRPQGRKRR